MILNTTLFSYSNCSCEFYYFFFFFFRKKERTKVLRDFVRKASQMDWGKGSWRSWFFICFTAIYSRVGINMMIFKVPFSIRSLPTQTSLWFYEHWKDRFLRSTNKISFRVKAKKLPIKKLLDHKQCNAECSWPGNSTKKICNFP